MRESLERKSERLEGDAFRMFVNRTLLPMFECPVCCNVSLDVKGYSASGVLGKSLGERKVYWCQCGKCGLRALTVPQSWCSEAIDGLGCLVDKKVVEVL